MLHLKEASRHWVFNGAQPNRLAALLNPLTRHSPIRSSLPCGAQRKQDGRSPRSELPPMCADGKSTTLEPIDRFGGRSSVKLPKIKTLNHQIDVIEANSTATEARLANMEKLLERIAEQLEKKAG
jgi:hypothetical protein